MISEEFWDSRIFSSLDMQRKFVKMHVDPLENLPSVEDLALLNVRVQKHLLAQGAIKEMFAQLKFEAKVSLYNNIVDGVAAYLVCYAGCRKTEVEAMEKVAWEDGLQHRPVGSKLSQNCRSKKCTK